MTTAPADEAVHVIRPARGWVGLDLRALWEYRELLYFLTWRDVKVRYAQSALGAAWAILQPLLLMIVFSLFLGNLGGVSGQGVPYPIFSFAALVPWTLFASSLTAASGSLVTNVNLLSKVFFPRLLMPIAAAGSFLLDFALAFVVLLGMMFWYGLTPGLDALAVVPLTVLTLAAALGVGTALAAVNARYRDVAHAVPFVVQLWLFASPVAYPLSTVPERYHLIYALNPMAGVIEGFRWALLGTVPFPGQLLLVSTCVVVAVSVFGVFYFRRAEHSLADVV